MNGVNICWDSLLPRLFLPLLKRSEPSLYPFLHIWHRVTLV